MGTHCSLPRHLPEVSCSYSTCQSMAHGLKNESLGRGISASAAVKRKKNKKRNEFSSFRLLRTKKVKKTVSRPEQPWIFTLPAPNSAGATLHTHLPSTLCEIHPVSGVHPHSTSPYCCLLLIAPACPRPTLCNPMDCSTPGPFVLYFLLEFAQIHCR